MNQPPLQLLILHEELICMRPVSSGPGGAGGKPSARGAVGLGFDSRRLPSLGLSAPPASTRNGDGLPRSRSLEEEEKEPSCKWEPINPLKGRINKESKIKPNFSWMHGDASQMYQQNATLNNKMSK